MLSYFAIAFLFGAVSLGMIAYFLWIEPYFYEVLHLSGTHRMRKRIYEATRAGQVTYDGRVTTGPAGSAFTGGRAHRFCCEGRFWVYCRSSTPLPYEPDGVGIYDRLRQEWVVTYPVGGYARHLDAHLRRALSRVRLQASPEEAAEYERELRDYERALAAPFVRFKRLSPITQARIERVLTHFRSA